MIANFLSRACWEPQATARAGCTCIFKLGSNGELSLITLSCRICFTGNPANVHIVASGGLRLGLATGGIGVDLLLR